MHITLYGVILRATIIIIILTNLKTIIRWMKNYDGWINDLTRTVVKVAMGVTDPPQPQPSEHVFAPSIMTRPARRAETVFNPEEIADTLQNRRRSQQFDDTSADSDNFRYYLGPVLCCTQPAPPPVSDIIAANFCYPPPPLPEYYIGPAVFDVMGPPPMACCVAESNFSYPPPPLPWTRRSNANPLPSRPSPGGDQDRSNGPITRKSKVEPAVFDVMDPPPMVCNVAAESNLSNPPPGGNQDRSNGPITRKSNIKPAVFDVMDPPPMGSCVTEFNILIPPPPFPWASEYKAYPPL